MAARPVLRALHARLIAEGRQLGHDPTDDGEAEATYAVVRWLLDGMTMTAAAQALGVSRGLLYSWATSKSHPDRWQAIEDARRLAAHGLVDDAQAILDGSNPAAIAVDRERARMKQWTASRYNRAAYGEDRAAAVTINVADLHVAALTGGISLPNHDLTPQPHNPLACETTANDSKPLALLAPAPQSPDVPTP